MEMLFIETRASYISNKPLMCENHFTRDKCLNVSYIMLKNVCGWG